MASSGEVGGWWLYVIALLAQKIPSCPFTNDSISADEGSSISSRIALTFLVMLLLAAIACIARWAVPGGPAWGRSQQTQTIPGPCGWPVIGSLLCMRNLAHRRLAQLATEFGARRLMAFSLGDTRVVISSDPETARELLNSACFADRPLKLSAQLLLFHRAIGFAPYGAYWRNLRRIAATHLFSPKRIAGQEPYRQLETAYMLEAIETDSKKNGFVYVRKHLQLAALNNIMHSVFGQRYEPGSEEVETLRAMVREGYDLLGTFSWADHLSFLRSVDPQRIQQRCESLVPRVQKFVQKIIDEHRQRGQSHLPESDFVTVLLSLNDEEKLEDSDMVSVLWEMVFRGTDTTAILSEWILAEVVLHPHVQRRIHAELDDVIGTARTVVEEDIPKLPYLQAVIKETLRMHPPGPLLSWARLAIQDTAVAGHSIPAGTTAMVNMWSITHDPSIWAEPNVFKPERFMPEDGGSDVDVRGNDLRLAPFGAGRRVCPGRALGQATVQLWVARLLHHFEWIELPFHPVSLQEVLKLSCEMKKPLVARPLRRISVPFSV